MAGKCICCVLALVAVQSLVSAERTKGVDMTVLKVTTIAEPPYVIVKDPEGVCNDNYDGFMIKPLCGNGTHKTLNRRDMRPIDHVSPSD